MKNCVFCYRPVPYDCYVLIRGHLSGHEFKVENNSEFVCSECVKNASDHEPHGIEVGDVTLVREHS